MAYTLSLNTRPRRFQEHSQYSKSAAGALSSLAQNPSTNLILRLA